MLPYSSNEDENEQNNESPFRKLIWVHKVSPVYFYEYSMKSRQTG